MAAVPDAREPVPVGGPRALLVCNLLLAIAAFAGVWLYDRDRVEERFLRLVDRTNLALQTDLDLTVALLRGLLGLFEASRRVDAVEFRAYVDALDVRDSHPGLLGLGYARRVGPDEVPALEAEMWVQGEPDFRVWPLPSSREDAAIVFLEPPDRGNLRAHGYVMTSEPRRRAAMHRARDSGEGVASAAVTLVQEEGGRLPGFLIFFPHYAPGAPIGTVEERRAALLGYIYAPLRVREIFEGRTGVPRELAVRVHEQADARRQEPIYETADGPRVGHIATDRTLRVAGKTWDIRYASAEPADAWWRSPAWLVLTGGVVLSSLVYRLQVVQVRERVRAEHDAAALREGERRYRFLAAAMPDAVFTTDAGGRIAYTNGRWPAAVLGEPLPRSLLPVLHPDDREVVLRSWEEARSRREPWSASFRMRSPAAGWRWTLARATPQAVAGVVREWVGTLTDIEVQKQAEEALQREAEELERRVGARTAELQRSVRELENFAAVASHDLQEPLRKIVAFGDRLADALGTDIPPAAADALHRMRRSAQRLQQLISDLLTFSRISRAEVIATPVDLGAIAREARDDLLEGRTDGATIEVGDLPTAAGDPGLLRQLVVNLLENALKFHRPGVSPKVRVYAEPAGEEVEAGQRDRWFRLLVEDEGIGFDPKYLERIFQVFQRLHPADRYEGTGIGLAICQRVVELHGGRITARGAPSRGACFVSTLPCAAPGTREGGCVP